eukprot:TRINITY_DN32549_c0_g1_i1.p1 TRINITY_DN32549_c0_g1~~TRINITY_DN32549_c0_g1_i1.p1  ORF type:complete len:259 (+),score=25.12 TRINITY_DN32549_c0_g1_i1:125-901(+)
MADNQRHPELNSGSLGSEPAMLAALMQELERRLYSTSFATDSTAGEGGSPPDSGRSRASSGMSYRVAVVGSQGVGKSWLVERVANPEVSVRELECAKFEEYRVAKGTMPGGCNLWLTDTPAVGGPPPAKHILQVSIQLRGKVEAVLVCMDLSDPALYRGAQSLVADFRKSYDLVCVVGTKSDVADQTVLQEAIAWTSKHQLPFYQTSALKGDGIRGGRERQRMPSVSETEEYFSSPERGLPSPQQEEESCHCQACRIQ